jgi:hypothetical protein
MSSGRIESRLLISNTFIPQSMNIVESGTSGKVLEMLNTINFSERTPLEVFGLSQSRR